jgi:hypothetical protein
MKLCRGEAEVALQMKRTIAFAHVYILGLFTIPNRVLHVYHSKFRSPQSLDIHQHWLRHAILTLQSYIMHFLHRMTLIYGCGFHRLVLNSMMASCLENTWSYNPSDFPDAYIVVAKNKGRKLVIKL